MTQFDNILRQGLMDANLEQYGRVLRSVEAKEPDFSPRYLRERMRLLSAPQEWERRQTRPAPRRWKIPRGIAVAIAVLLLITAVAAAAVSLWVSYFGGLDQRQQEIVSDMELSDEKTGKTETTKTAAESLLPPPVEHDGVTITPLRLLGAKNKLYLILEIRAPEGTVFSSEDRYDLFDGMRVPEERRTEMLGSSGGFTVLEAGTREPNILVGVAETTTSFDIGGCSYLVRALYRYTPDGEQETVFGGWDPEAGPTDSWEFPIPEDLNRDQLLEPNVEGLSMTEGGKTTTLLSMSVSPLGVWWKYRLDGEDPWPRVRVALRMRDGSEVEAALGQLTMGDMGSGCTASVDFAKPVDLSQAEAVLWGDVEIPLEQGSEK
ncbi:DUF4179 domain-containing protein [uncultured Oscillibacter sp.]|uniref:DUF4179 domain-containing protein n=1 Tax=uncultured Oscillibacter sp. TaxID=876091 RepID=UPI00262C9762|nr:DUF4179 domain-containing protein [uncultured Oscillibacter sp.]